MQAQLGETVRYLNDALASLERETESLVRDARQRPPQAKAVAELMERVELTRGIIEENIPPLAHDPQNFYRRIQTLTTRISQIAPPARAPRQAVVDEDTIRH